MKKLVLVATLTVLAGGAEAQTQIVDADTPVPRAVKNCPEYDRAMLWLAYNWMNPRNKYVQLGKSRFGYAELDRRAAAVLEAIAKCRAQ